VENGKQVGSRGWKQEAKGVRPQPIYRSYSINALDNELVPTWMSFSNGRKLELVMPAGGC